LTSKLAVPPGRNIWTAGSRKGGPGQLSWCLHNDLWKVDDLPIDQRYLMQENGQCAVFINDDTMSTIVKQFIPKPFSNAMAPNSLTQLTQRIRGVDCNSLAFAACQATDYKKETTEIATVN